MASAPAEMALTDSHNHTESRICSVLGVPPILISANVGLQRSTFSNYREARFSFHSETLEPLIDKIVRFLNYCIGMEMGETIAVDLTEMRAKRAISCLLEWLPPQQIQNLPENIHLAVDFWGKTTRYGANADACFSV